jgi:hypothetical protein
MIKPIDLRTKKIHELAAIVRGDWEKVHVTAQPYLKAMERIQNIEDDYGSDRASMIVSYFLSNAKSWTGNVARAVKAELNRRLKD